MGRPKILVAVGTRPEAVKLAPVVRGLREADWCDVDLLATAQHREMLDHTLGFFGIDPDVDLDLMQPGQGLADLTSRMVSAVDAVLDESQPDFVLAQGDTTTVFVTALCCFYRQVAFGHVEAGLRTHLRESPFPEEMNRRLVATLADLHFAPTPLSAENLESEGIPDTTVFVTGNTVIDALLWAVERVDDSVFRPAAGRRLVLVTAHRRENFGERFEQICTALSRIADREDVEILYPVHLNPNVRAPVESLLAAHPSIHLTDPLGYPEFVAAMKASHLILTDSGGVQEEAASLGKPVLVMRDDTERLEGIEAGTAELVGTRADRIVERTCRLLDDPDAYGGMARIANPYGDGRAATRIVEILRQRLA